MIVDVGTITQSMCMWGGDRMIFHNRCNDVLTIKCDGCKMTIPIMEGQTDRCIGTQWAKENGWRIMKDHNTGKWIHLCPECYEELRKKNRERWLNNG